MENDIEILNSVPIPDYERFELKDPFGNRVEMIQYYCTLLFWSSSAFDNSSMISLFCDCISFRILSIANAVKVMIISTAKINKPTKIPPF